MLRIDFPAGRVCSVPVHINGEEFELAFDTGAQYVAVTRHVINWLHLTPSSRTTRVLAANSQVASEPRPIYPIASVDLFGLIAHDVDAVEIELPASANIDGLLGISFLQHFRFTADYGEGWIEIGERASA